MSSAVNLVVCKYVATEIPENDWKFLVSKRSHLKLKKMMHSGFIHYAQCMHKICLMHAWCSIYTWIKLDACMIDAQCMDFALFMH